MASVVSKITGDGKSTATAFTTNAQQYGAPITAGTINVDPLTGQPTSQFAVLQIPDPIPPQMALDPGIVILPDPAASLTALAKTQLTTRLALQGCVVNLGLAQTGADVLVAVQAAAVIVAPPVVVG